MQIDMVCKNIKNTFDTAVYYNILNDKLKTIRVSDLYFLMAEPNKLTQ